MTPSNDFDVYIPVYNAVPQNWEDARGFLLARLREVTESLNNKDYGLYIDRDTLNGQSWIPGTDPVKFRDVIRHVVDIGGLPDFAVTDPKEVPHNIQAFSENSCITRLYGCATNPGLTSITKGIPLPYVDMPGGANIGLEIDDTNIIINGDGATDYSDYTCCFVVVEWIDEA